MSLEDTSQQEFQYQLDIPGGVVSCKASQLGLRPGDFANPQYREAYSRVMILRENDNATEEDDFIHASVSRGSKHQNMLDRYMEKNEGNGLERKLLFEEGDGRYVVRVSRQIFAQMHRLGFNIVPIEPPKRREHHERP